MLDDRAKFGGGQLRVNRDVHVGWRILMLGWAWADHVRGVGHNGMVSSEIWR